MKNIIRNIIITLSIIFLWILAVNAEAIPLSGVDWIDNITDKSIDVEESTIYDISIDILKIIKYIISWVLLIFMVYIGAQMIISMWTDEEALSSSKRQIWYSMIWLLFINVPWNIYNTLKTTQNNEEITRSILITDVDLVTNIDLSANDPNLIINSIEFNTLLNSDIIWFIELIVFAVAVAMIIISGINMINSVWKDEDLKEAKNKILRSLIWLVFIWFIESLQYFMYTWDIGQWALTFETFEKLALFFAAPIALFFITLAWYYFITSNWDDDKVKKAKSIIINVLLWTVILLTSHLFLKDLLTL
mgnify:CR=1 FL=1